MKVRNFSNMNNNSLIIIRNYAKKIGATEVTIFDKGEDDKNPESIYFSRGRKVIASYEL